MAARGRPEHPLAGQAWLWAGVLYSPKWTSTTYTLLLLLRLGLRGDDAQARLGVRLRSGSQHGSFHTTITVLEALRELRPPAARPGEDSPVVEAVTRGEQFLLRHRLFRSRTTGAVADEALLRFPFPPQWHYDVLRGLEHFEAVGAPWDDRLQDAVNHIERVRRRDGRWPRHAPYPGRQWFTMEPRGAGRWATLRCLRVLSWAERVGSGT